jgi:hypothetical protein
MQGRGREGRAIGNIFHFPSAPVTSGVANQPSSTHCHTKRSAVNSGSTRIQRFSATPRKVKRMTVSDLADGARAQSLGEQRDVLQRGHTGAPVDLATETSFECVGERERDRGFCVATRTLPPVTDTEHRQANTRDAHGLAHAHPTSRCPANGCRPCKGRGSRGVQGC